MTAALLRIGRLDERHIDIAHSTGRAQEVTTQQNKRVAVAGDRTIPERALRNKHEEYTHSSMLGTKDCFIACSYFSQTNSL